MRLIRSIIICLLMKRRNGAADVRDRALESPQMRLVSGEVDRWVGISMHRTSFGAIAPVTAKRGTKYIW